MEGGMMGFKEFDDEVRWERLLMVAWLSRGSLSLTEATDFEAGDGEDVQRRSKRGRQVGQDDSCRLSRGSRMVGYFVSW